MAEIESWEGARGRGRKRPVPATQALARVSAIFFSRCVGFGTARFLFVPRATPFGMAKNSVRSVGHSLRDGREFYDFSFVPWDLELHDYECLATP